MPRRAYRNSESLPPGLWIGTPVRFKSGVAAAVYGMDKKAPLVTVMKPRYSDHQFWVTVDAGPWGRIHVKLQDLRMATELEALSQAHDNPVKLSRSYWLGPHRWGAYHTLRANAGLQYVPRPISARDLAEGYDQAHDVYLFLSAAYDPRKELNPGAFDHAAATRALNEAWALVDSREKEKAAKRYRTFVDIATGPTTDPNEAANARLRAENLQKKWKQPLGEFRPARSRAAVREREVMQAFGQLNNLLHGKQVKWLGDYADGASTGEPYAVFRGKKQTLQLPPGYAPASERPVGVGRRRVRAAESVAGWESAEAEAQINRYLVVTRAAEKLLRHQYSSVLWGVMDKGKRNDRVAEAVAMWSDPSSQVGSNGGRSVRAQLVQLREKRTLSGPELESVFTEAFSDNGITLSALRRPAPRVELGDAYPAPVDMSSFLASMKEVTDYVTRLHIKWDREALGKAMRTGEDLFTQPRTPEEILEEQRGESHSAVREKRQELMEQALYALEASGQEGKVKSTLIRLHMGQDVLPGQPNRLLGRLDSFGERTFQTSRAWQDFSGDVYRKDKKGRLILKRQEPRYHPYTADAPCPTCKAISRFVAVRGMGAKEVAAAIDDWAGSLLAQG
jgi:hypothetical protein